MGDFKFPRIFRSLSINGEGGFFGEESLRDSNKLKGFTLCSQKFSHAGESFRREVGEFTDLFAQDGVARSAVFEIDFAELSFGIALKLPFERPVLIAAIELVFVNGWEVSDRLDLETRQSGGDGLLQLKGNLIPGNLFGRIETVFNDSIEKEESHETAKDDSDFHE